MDGNTAGESQKRKGFGKEGKKEGEKKGKSGLREKCLFAFS